MGRYITVVFAMMLSVVSVSAPVRSNLSAKETSYIARADGQLPDGLVAVEYIESTGTQWLDTGYIFDTSKDLIILGYAGFNTTARGELLSNYVDGWSMHFAIELYSSMRFRVYYSEELLNFTSGVSLREMFPYSCIFKSVDRKFICNVNGIEKEAYTSKRLGMTARTALIGSDYRHTNMFGMYGHIKIYNPDIVRDMIPVRFVNEGSEDEGAMYDTVTKQLLRNQGTGKFLIGPDKE